MKRAGRLIVLATCASLLGACRAFEPLGQKIGIAILEPMVFVFTGDESVSGRFTEDDVPLDTAELQASLYVRVQALPSAEIVIDEDASHASDGARIRVQRLEVARREGEPDTALTARGIFAKDCKLSDGLEALTGGDRLFVLPRFSVLICFEARANELAEQALLLERVGPPDRLGPLGEIHVGPVPGALIVEVRRLNPADPEDPEYTGHDVLYFVGGRAYTDLHGFRECVSRVRHSQGERLGRVRVHFSSHCTLGDLTSTLQALVDVGEVDMLLLLMEEGQHGPALWEG